ncbi:MAG: phosphatidylglycerophosphatase A [Burkholderiales bacterium]|nr:MAG: phosphatidylglycerophosphatase A [Burkholderiales bacterium]
MSGGDRVEAVEDAGPVRPSAAFMVRRLSRLIALGFGSGLSPIGPGTVGTLWAWLAFVVFDPWLSDTSWAILIGAGFLVGIWACGRTAEALGRPDAGAIVWDEIVAFWLVLWLLPAGFGWQFAGFALFRLLDVLKPPPIRQLERRLSGGLGIMADDLLAAFFALLILALFR